MDFLVSLQIKTKIYTMKVSLLKMSRNKEVINRLELQQLADMIRKGSLADRKIIELSSYKDYLGRAVCTFLDAQPFRFIQTTAL